jgi:hypothetical protein
MRFVDVIRTLRVPPKMNSHCVRKLWWNIHNKMQYLNFDVNLILTNEYEKQFIVPPFTL